MKAEHGMKFAMIPEWVMDRLRGKPNALVLYAELSLRVYSDNGWACSQQELADAMGCSIDTIWRQTKILIAAQAIKVEHTTMPNGEAGWNKYFVQRSNPLSHSASARSRSPRRREVPPRTSAVHTKTEGKKTTRTHTASARPNKYSGKCDRCGKTVAAGAGILDGVKPVHVECPREKPLSELTHEDFKL